MYDNVAEKRKPKVKKPGEEEDVYGSVPEDETLYDNTGRAIRGMHYSKDQIYDNPESKRKGTYTRT